MPTPISPPCHVCGKTTCKTSFATVSYTFNNNVDIEHFAAKFHELIHLSGWKVHGYAIILTNPVVHVWLDIENLPFPSVILDKLAFPSPPGIFIPIGMRAHKRCTLVLDSFKGEVQFLRNRLQGRTLVDDMIIRGLPSFIQIAVA